jgi:hypothetical protein
MKGKFFCPFQYPKVPLEAGAPPPHNLLMLPTPVKITDSFVLFICLQVNYVKRSSFEFLN